MLTVTMVNTCTVTVFSDGSTWCSLCKWGLRTRTATHAPTAISGIRSLAHWSQSLVDFVAILLWISFGLCVCFTQHIDLARDIIRIISGRLAFLSDCASTKGFDRFSLVSHADHAVLAIDIASVVAFHKTKLLLSNV